MQHGTEALNDNNQPHIVLFQEELEDSVSCKAANVLSRWHRFTTKHPAKMAAGFLLCCQDGTSFERFILMLTSSI